ncbi:MAG: cellulase family glycosylhydrolase [Verrucomicrobia bacterium]|nr:cellulase family glycosylhydrolase [Verrucomicrobiota bacterium]
MNTNHRASTFLPAIFVSLLSMVGVGGSLAQELAVRPAQSRFQHFITRQSNKLYDGEKEFRFVGANMPGLVLPYDYTLSLPERMRLPTPWEQEDALKTLDQMNGRVVRTWNLPMCDPKAQPQPWHYVLGPGKFNEEAFKVVDNLFALANKYGVRVMLDLTAESGDYLGGIGTYAAWRGKKRAEFYTDPQLKEDYKATVRHVLTRTNTITGVAYRDDKAVLAWQFGNEMHTAPDAWLSEMAAFIKSFDKNHLVAETRHRPGQPLLVDLNIDLVTRHLYSNYRGVEGGWPGAMRAEMAKLNGARPMFIGEFGPYIDGKMFMHANVVDKLREFLDYVQSDPGICGSLLWSMYFHHNDGGFYWHQIMTYPAVWSYHWPGFPSADAQREIGIMAAMREAAFKIQGLPVPPVPVPDAPELLPIGDVPFLSWRGAAGATGYDVEHAPKAAGPWKLIAGNVCDGDVAYRPLFSDTTARAGQTCFYRVTARNASGTSKPSNVVGPVKVKRVCFVDELQDFSRVHAKSDGLTLNNDYNALYAEFLFRAKGNTNDWLSYRVPAPMQTVKVVAFFAKDTTDLTLQVSTDGKKFTTLQSKRTERRLPAPPRGATVGQRRTMVEYECSVPAGNRQLKVLWNGPAELDRVEIYQ